MSLKGSATQKQNLRGSINKLVELRGYSAYEIALIYGYKGTEEEWLASLKGEKPIKGIDYFTPEDVRYIVNEVAKNAASARIGNVTLLASNWVGTDSLYSQVVTVEGVTENSQVDLTPSVEQLAIFYDKDLTFVTENEDGVVTVYVIGQKPENDYNIQVTITEVEYE